MFLDRLTFLFDFNSILVSQVIDSSEQAGPNGEHARKRGAPAEANATAKEPLRTDRKWSAKVDGKRLRLCQ